MTITNDDSIDLCVYKYIMLHDIYKQENNISCPTFNITDKGTYLNDRQRRCYECGGYNNLRCPNGTYQPMFKEDIDPILASYFKDIIKI